MSRSGVDWDELGDEKIRRVYSYSGNGLSCRT